MKDYSRFSKNGEFDRNDETLASLFEKLSSNPLEEIKVSDNIKIQGMVEDISKYDKRELLQRVAALRLEFKNRDKAVLLDAITTATLNWLSENNWNFEGFSMSYGKFKKVIQKINQLASKSAIDPLDNPYVDDIQFYGNHKVMPGINLTSSYNLNMVIRSIFLSSRIEVSTEEKNYISILLDDNLAVSTNICEKCQTPKELSSITREIFIPNKIQLDNYMEEIYLDKSLIGVSEISIKREEVDLVKQKPFSQNQHLFLTHPYLDTGKGVILLDVTSIANALYTKVMNLIPEEYVFEEIWNDVRRSFKSLKHEKIANDSFGLDLLNEGGYKERIFNVTNDKLLVVFGVFSGVNENMDHSEKITSRLELIVKKLSEHDIKNDQLFIVMVVHTLGGSLSASIKQNNLYKNIPFAQFRAMELKAISKVEIDDIFLPRFMRAKMQLLEPYLIGAFGEGDFIPAIMFSENDLSFYVGDDIDYRGISIHMGIEETSDYYLKAQQKSAERLFYSMFDRNWHTAIKEEFSNRYLYNRSVEQRFRGWIETKNKKVIEIVTEKFNSGEEADILFNSFDLISYWLEQYYSIAELPENYVIYLHIEEDLEKYYLADEVNTEEPVINVRKAENIIIWDITSQIYQKMGMAKKSSYERKLISELIDTLEISDLDVLDRIFYPEYKKKMTGLLLDDNGKLRVPTHGFQLLKISEYEANQLLDELGEYLKEQGYAYGAIPKKDNPQFCNKIVGFLYSILEKEVNVFSKNQLLKFLMAQIETLLPVQLRGESSYNNDIALSVQEKDRFFEQLNENNRNSIATKFLLEYVVASPITGKKSIGMWEIERLLAICSLIIEWAHRSDYFKYNFVDTTINFLQSNRIGIKKKDFKNVNSAMLASRNLQLENSNLSISENRRYVERVEQLFESKLDGAFVEAFGYSYEEFNLVIGSLIDTHNNLEKIVWIEEEDELVHKIFNDLDKKISEIKIVSVLDSITLLEREKYLTPPMGFEKLDIFPWRFNRRLSFIRRPLLKYSSRYIFGVRNVIYAQKYLMRLIWGGRLKTNSQKMKDVMSKLRNILGDEFNDQVKNILGTYSDLQVIKGVSKIGKQRISDEKNNTLGDIDVLAINQNHKKLFVIETKDFSFSRNPYELAMEQEKVFTGNKAFLTKHLKRSDWIRKNLECVIDNYGLEAGDWKVVTVFVVSEQLMTKDLLDTKGVKFISLKELNCNLFK